MLPQTEAIRLISLALADKITGTKVSVNTNRAVGLDTLMDLLNRVHKGETELVNANLDIVKGEWHFDTN